MPSSSLHCAASGKRDISAVDRRASAVVAGVRRGFCSRARLSPSATPRYRRSPSISSFSLRPCCVYAGSSAAAGTPAHVPMLAALRRLFEATQRDGRVAMVYETRVFVGNLG